MSYETFIRLVHLSVTQYLAIFCLITIVLWSGGLFLWAKHWERPVRDCGIFLLAIGALTVILLVDRHTSSADTWTPIYWFSFTMLLVLELLWLSSMVDALLRATSARLWRAHQERITLAEQRTARTALERAVRQSRP